MVDSKVSVMQGHGSRPGRTVACLLAGLAAVVLAPSPSQATLSPVVTETGKIFFSIDGVGTNDVAGGTVDVEKPAGATVRTAFLSCAAVGFGSTAIPDGGVSINTTAVNWDQNIANGQFPSNVFANVTAIVKPTLDAAGPGRTSFTIVEASPPNIDGCALGVVFDDPNQATDSTVIALFGGQNTGGDSFAITLAEPLDVSDPSARADMGLAISFSAQDQSGVGGSTLCGVQSAMFSVLDVNGSRLTSCAGNADDGVGPIANGMLFTVGGLDDSNDNPADPNQQAGDSGDPRVTEDELYSLKPFVQSGDTLISVDTVNPSDDDNIFVAYFVTSVPSVLGEGIVLAPLTATNAVGTQHTVTATVVDDTGTPIQGRTVDFEITAGPHVGQTGSDVTDADGKARFSYTGSSTGTDTIVSRFTDQSSIVHQSNTATKLWEGQGPTSTPSITNTPTETPSMTSTPTETPTPMVPMPPILSVTSSDPHDFGDVPVGQQRSFTYMVTNVGKGTLTGTASASCAGFSVLPTDFMLGENEKITLVVTFAPPSDGPFTCELQVTSNGGSATRGLSGGGAIVEPAPVPIVPSPTSPAGIAFIALLALCMGWLLRPRRVRPS